MRMLELPVKSVRFPLDGSFSMSCFENFKKLSENRFGSGLFSLLAFNSQMGEIKEKRRAKYIVKFLSKIWKFMRSVVNLISPLKISQCPNELFGKTEMPNAIFCTWFDGQRENPQIP